ncbi:MAG TPA: tetratricopeptide repeat-containing sensor histidine kinase [Draconibacterium sp.]|nr:tetratricopeptide repeat-containing sensor histidine kinase [Draconibacterium sp.]
MGSYKKHIGLILFLVLFIDVSLAYSNETTKIDSLKIEAVIQSDSTKLVDIYLDLSDLYGYFDSDSSLEYAQKALTLARQANYRHGEGTALFLISYVYDQSGDWTTAIANLEKAIEIFTETNDSLFLTTCYLNIGVLYSYGTDLQKGLDYTIKALVFCEENNETHALSAAYSNIAWYYERLKEYRNSLYYNEKALEVNIEINDADYQSLSHITLGNILLKLHSNDEALYHLNEALKLLPQIADKQREVELMLGFINYYFEIDDLIQAKTYINRILNKKDEAYFKKLAVEINSAQGKYYLKKQDYETAVSYYTNAIRQSEKLGKYDYLPDYYNEKAEAHAGLHQYEKAYEMISKAHEVSDILKTEEITRILADFEKNEMVRAERRKLILEQELASEKIEINQFKFRAKAVFIIIFLVLLSLMLTSFLIMRKKHTDELKASYNTINQQKILLEENIGKLAEDENKLKKLNATKDKFFSIIAHDLKNPFNILIGISELLRNEKDTRNSENFDQFINGMYQAATNGYKLLENLLEWSRTQTGSIRFEPRPFFIHKVFETNKSLCLETARAKDLNIEVSDKKTMVYADHDMVNFIVRNLLNNAIKFSNRKGKIELYTEKSGSMLIITVKDNGIGMTSDLVNNLFKIEKQVQREGTAHEKGTGLGLVLCQEFVKMNGGDIWVESEPNKGSSFHFSLSLSLS